MRAQLQYRLPQTPELLTICLAIVCVSFSPSSLFPVSRCLYLSWTRRRREYRGRGRRWGWLAEVPITCLGSGARMFRGRPAAGREKPRGSGLSPEPGEITRTPHLGTRSTCPRPAEESPGAAPGPPEPLSPSRRPRGSCSGQGKGRARRAACRDMSRTDPDRDNTACISSLL